MFSDNRLLIYLGVFVVTGAIAATTEIPLPDGVQKVTTVEDRIEHCDISGHGGRFGASFLFVGMRLSNLDVPYLRWNTEKSKRSEIETMCNKRQLVNITYLAKRKLVRPQVTYWIETIEIIPIPAT
jgi:hypothetical protein